MKRGVSILIIFIFMLSLFLITPVSAATITTQDMGDGVTPTAMVNSLVGIGSGVTGIANISYLGVDSSAGFFSGGASIFGFDGGLVLSSGNIAHIIGPNIYDDATQKNELPGDADLDTIIAPEVSLDATVLEFDFIPEHPYVALRYVFGSEEYNEYVGEYNDPFGFFVNGVNYAVFSNGLPVSINNINLYVNSQYFRNNDPSDTNTPYDTGMDGFSYVLNAVAPVNPGVVNHMKLAIADASDDQLDTFVLIEEMSFGSVKYPPSRPWDYHQNNASILAITKPLALTQYNTANELWACVVTCLPEEVPEDVQEMIGQAQEHMANAASLSNPIYSNSELVKAIKLMENISEALGCECS